MSPSASSTTRDPLSSIAPNTLAASTITTTPAPAPAFTLPPSAPSSSSSYSRKAYIPWRERKLAPIFTSRPSSSGSRVLSSSPPEPEPTTPTTSSRSAASVRARVHSATGGYAELGDENEPPSLTGSPRRKKARISHDRLDVPLAVAGERTEQREGACSEDECASDRERERDVVGVKRDEEVTRYFMPTTPTRARPPRSAKEVLRVEPAVSEMAVGDEERDWRIARPRRGVRAFKSRMTRVDYTTAYAPQTPYLHTLVHSLIPYSHSLPPSSILLPSLHPPTGRSRDWAPPMSVRFNHVVKTYDAASASHAGVRRLMAVAGEEGGVRIVDVDEPLMQGEDGKGWWWRAHANAVFDMKWSGDDSRILTASGDQTTRLHSLSSSTPTLLATLRGHTSSVKCMTFFDPSRSSAASPAAAPDSIVATAGRDGSILIFDIRCPGRRVDDGIGATGEASYTEEYSTRRSSRERDRYSAGIPGFSPLAPAGREVDPVCVIRGAHADSGSGKRSGQRTAVKSVTSLVALQSMPGMIASGGSSDGVVKLWDIRFPSATKRNPEPSPRSEAALVLPDPTVLGANPSRRSRAINSLVENPLTGDLYALCGDSRIHTLRPSAALYPSASTPEAVSGIMPQTFSHPDLFVSSFFVKMGISPCGKYLAAGSGKGGLVTFETSPETTLYPSSAATPAPDRERRGATLGLGEAVGFWSASKPREVSALDWGKDCLAACADDLVTRIWRRDAERAKGLREEREKWGHEWVGADI